MTMYETVRAAFHALIGVSDSDIQNAYGMSGDWCMMTVWTGFRNADALDLLCGGEKTAWVPTAWDYYNNRGMTGNSPKAGALVFYDYNGNGTPDHIEYCDSVNGDGTFNCISGNSGRDYVFEETVGMYGVLGFAYPDYDKAENEENIQIEEDNTMRCIFQYNDSDKLCYYDGAAVHYLTHPDEVTAIQMVYKQCTGKDIPMFKLGSGKAPWASRFVNAVSGNIEPEVQM